MIPSTYVVLFLIGVFSHLTPFGVCQEECVTTPLQDGGVENYCTCTEHPNQMREAILKLTLNLKGCENSSLPLDWDIFQTEIPNMKTVDIIHATISFIHTEEPNVNSTLTEVVFKNCIFNTIPHNAFVNLKMVKTITFVNSLIDTIESNSFSGLPYLHIIEFANTDINMIEEDAFKNLPLIENLAFINSQIKTLSTNAIHILEPPNPLPTAEECYSLEGRSDMSADTFMNEFSGRSLTYIQNVSLPENGSTLLFFNSEVETFAKQSINTDAFAYFILGGNTVRVIGEQAFKATLRNLCDISAFLFIQNNITEVESKAFLNVSGKEQDQIHTVLAVMDNTFNNVHHEGFLLNPHVQTSHIQKNKFNCTCELFNWILRNEDSENQKQFKKSLVETGSCLEGKSLLDFLKQCDEIRDNLPNTETSGSSRLHFQLGLLSFISLFKYIY